ncbi:MAG: hypothetical protein II961_03720 [Candidatus Riflebacteria bacterium]|nr:hypothetical protein [Candidatus Riflebacteria bacterium]
MSKQLAAFKKLRVETVFGLNFLLFGKNLKNPPSRLPLAVSPFSLAFARQLPHRSWGSIAFEKGDL